MLDAWFQTSVPPVALLVLASALGCCCLVILAGVDPHDPLTRGLPQLEGKRTKALMEAQRQVIVYEDLTIFHPCHVLSTDLVCCAIDEEGSTMRAPACSKAYCRAGGSSLP